MQRLELILLALLSSCIHSERFQSNLNYLRSLQAEEIYQDLNGTYYKVLDSKNNCKIEFEPRTSIETNLSLNPEDLTTTMRLYREQCLD